MNNIDYSKMITAAQLDADEQRVALEAAFSLRRSAYLAESDSLRLEAEYDALSMGRAPDYTGWIASVASIKARYPLPLDADSAET